MAGVAGRGLLLTVMVAGGLLIANSAGLADPVAPAAPVTATTTTTPDAPPVDDPNEIICKAGEPALGSRFPGPRRCHTRREWAQIQKDSQDALFHLQMQRSCNAGSQC